MREKPARTPRFYVDARLKEGARVELAGAAAHHVLRVLRLREGDALTLFDGNGGEWDALLLSKSQVELKGHRDVERESPLQVVLVQGVSSGERMDFTVQKAVELGVAAIQPVLSRKSIVRLEGSRADARVEHWRRVAVAACEQCGRNRIPGVRALLSLEAYCASAGDPEPRLLLSPGGSSMKPLPLERKATLAAGPEAGFSADEEAALEAAGFSRVALGPRVLRTETAALAALAALNALQGDF
jgi:16S rRNA (uracil1498-N3)-methyltransferase